METKRKRKGPAFSSLAEKKPQEANLGKAADNLEKEAELVHRGRGQKRKSGSTLKG